MSLRPLYTFGLRSSLWAKPQIQNFSQIRTFGPPRFSRTYRQFTTNSARNARYLRFEVDPEKPWDVRSWDTQTRVAVGLAVLGAVYYIAHLEQVPETGRWRFIDVSPKFETMMAKEAHKELMKEYKGQVLPENHPVTRYIRSIVTRILESSDLGTIKSDPMFIAPAGVPVQDLWSPDSGRNEDVVPGSGGREWELIVVNDENMVNAMASFGNIVVFTGILPVAKDEDGLAAVLGHEIAHVVARHNAERYSYLKVLFLTSMLLEYFGFDFGLARLSTTLLLDLPNSRTHELEADKIGLKLTSKACFDPKSATQMFVRLGEAEKAQNSLRIDFLGTHPASEKRVQRLGQLLPEAYSIRAASPTCAGMQDNFKTFLDIAGFDNVGLGATSTPVVPIVEWRFK